MIALVATLVPVRDVEPQHPVTNRALVKALARSIEERGWSGRPLVVADYGPMGNLVGKRYLALNGTHRLAALKKLGQKKVPAVVVDVSRWPYTDARALDEALEPVDRADLLEAHRKNRLARWVLDEGWAAFDGK